MSAPPIRKYNPGFLTDDQLVDTFCARQGEYESILETLRECTASSNRHLLIIGPRGSGKTTLLLRVAAQVRREADLSARLLPVVFAEESYRVATCGEFWLECLARLAEHAADTHEVDLVRSWEDLRSIRDDDTLALRCLAAVLDFAEMVDKRLLLVVENLNMMFADMMDRDAGWRLRKTLQTEPRIVLLGSATSRFDEMDHPDRALYDLFHVYWLRPLNTDECAALWRNVSGKEPESPKIRAVEILTGGSPRLLAMMAQFGATLSFRELMGDLLDLVDEHTDYFKSHLESLPGQERRVYLAIAEQWEPATTREIALRARIDINKCSAWLKRLTDRGLVVDAGRTPRRKRYHLTERMYNIYYLLRVTRGSSQVVQALVRFMVSFYSPPEIRSIDKIAMREWTSSERDVSGYENLLEQSNAVVSPTQQDILDSLSTYDQVLASFCDRTKPEVATKILFNRDVTLGRLDRREEEVSAFDLLALMFRVAAAIEAQDKTSATRDASEMLVYLSTMEELPRICLDLLMVLGVEIGPEAMMELIEASPCRDMLYPLYVVAQRNTGMEPVVSPEVDAVVQDILRRLKILRSAGNHVPV